MHWLPLNFLLPATKLLLRPHRNGRRAEIPVSPPPESIVDRPFPHRQHGREFRSMTAAIDLAARSPFLAILRSLETQSLH
jgi:hypothetical protein